MIMGRHQNDDTIDIVMAIDWCVIFFCTLRCVWLGKLNGAGKNTPKQPAARTQPRGGHGNGRRLGFGVR